MSSNFDQKSLLINARVTSILSLPYELLCMIVAWVFADFDRRASQFEKDAISIMLVCKLWKSVVNSCLPNWTHWYIHPDMSIPRLCTWVEKSGSALLAVWLNLSSAVVTVEDRDIRTFLAKIAPLLSPGLARCDQLVVFGLDADASYYVMQYLHTVASDPIISVFLHLEDIPSIDSQLQVGTDHAIAPMFSGNLPSLIDIILDETLVRWSPSVFMGTLTHLALNNISGRSGPSWPFFRDFFASAVCLKSLSLCDVECERFDEGSSAHIVFHHLVEVFFAFSKPSSVKLFVKFEFPVLCRLRITTNEDSPLSYLLSTASSTFAQTRILCLALAQCNQAQLHQLLRLVPLIHQLDVRPCSAWFVLNFARYLATTTDVCPALLDVCLPTNMGPLSVDDFLYRRALGCFAPNCMFWMPSIETSVADFTVYRCNPASPWASALIEA
ncbi:hypothetical protein C8R43DRAFT_1140588 [Mycena crocata]|nr:hypothetical protein C8R43DRAFT_1140588 [Mycena crocata]